MQHSHFSCAESREGCSAPGWEMDDIIALVFRWPWYESVPPLDLSVLKSKERSLSWHLYLLVQDLPSCALCFLCLQNIPFYSCRCLLDPPSPWSPRRRPACSALDLPSRECSQHCFSLEAFLCLEHGSCYLLQFWCLAKL